MSEEVAMGEEVVMAEQMMDGIVIDDDRGCVNGWDGVGGRGDHCGSGNSSDEDRTTWTAEVAIKVSLQAWKDEEGGGGIKKMHMNSLCIIKMTTSMWSEQMAVIVESRQTVCVV